MSVKHVMELTEKREQALKDLVGKRIKVGTDGYIELDAVLGSDEYICQKARGTSGSDRKGPEADRQLIRYLKRHSHTTPLEFAEMVFKVRCPMDVWRQWIRHRTASVNEYSTRYSPAIDATALTKPQAWRNQSKTNRQGSSALTVTEWPEDYKLIPAFQSLCGSGYRSGPDGNPVTDNEETTPGEYLSVQEEELQLHAREVYNERLKFGVAFEQARKDLPLSTYTEAYWKSDLHNLLHFLSLRMDGHAQKEIQEFAWVIGVDFVEPLFPFVWESFNDFDFRRNARLLSFQEAQIARAIVRDLNHKVGKEHAAAVQKLCFDEWAAEFGWTEKSGERTEAIAKLSNLGILHPDNLKESK